MRANAVILIVIGLLLLVGTVAAALPDTVSITSNKNWIVADGIDQSVITVEVTNSTLPVANANVVFSLNNSLGTLSSMGGVTSPSGTASTTFTSKTISGATLITADVTYSDADGSYTNTVTLTQNIDHGILTPKITPDFAVVNETKSFTISITDQYRNPIDTRRYPDDTVTLTVSCPLPNDCNFVGSGYSYSAKPDSNGNITISLKLGTKAGQTVIVMNPVQDVGQRLLWIDTKLDSPARLTAAISPYPTANVGSGVFYFNFTLADRWGNPVPNELVLVQITSGEKFTVTTNSIGQTSTIPYGPKGSAQTVNVTATVNSTPSVNTAFSLEFVNAQPTMSLSVTPQSMSSLDYYGVTPTSADVVVRVRDDFGNPISGQTIVLALDYTWGANWTDPPTLAPYDGITDATGAVRTTFTAGKFKSNTTETGSAKLTANWVQDPFNNPKNVTITWSNSPYVNIYPTVSSDIVKVGDFIDVTLSVAVNGQANTGPLTIVLDQDATSNMGRSIAGSPTSMEWDASNASKTFISKLNPIQTRIGMESFGDATISPPVGKLNIPSTFSQVNAELDNLSVLKLTGSGQDYYGSLDRSLNKIKNDGHPENVKVVVFLSDGGSILTATEKSNLINKAIGNGTEAELIRIMTICYTNNPNEPSGAVQLRELSTATGGTAFIARNADDLASKFQEILVIISELCGPNTLMTISFDNITINKTYTATSGTEIYDYIPVNIPAGLPVGVMSAPSTTINSSARTSIIWPNNNQSIINQSNQFPLLQFNIGKVGLGKNWTTTFRLKAKKVGCYNLFGPGSAIDFGTGTLPLTLPDIPICVNTTVNDTGVLQGTLNVTDLHTLSSGPFADFVPIQWNTYYNSSNNAYFATEKIYYNIAGGPWVQFNTKSVPPADYDQLMPPLYFDVRDIPRGSTINIWVHASAPDADDDNDYLNSIMIVNSTNPYIIIK